MNTLAAILWKDLVSEWRSRDRVLAMGLFAFLVVVVLRFALPETDPREVARLAPGLLWIAYLFAALFGLNRSFALELENDALAGLALAPADRGFVYLGKALANFLLLLLVQGATAVVFGVAFALDWWPIATRLACVVALGSLGICSVGTLFSAIAVRTRYREVMLPLLLVPLLIPVLLGAVSATAALLADGALPFAPLQLLVVTDAIFLIVSFVAFEYVLDD